MTEPIYVAQLVGNAELGGVSNCILNYYKEIDRERFKFDFITYGESSLDDKIRELGGDVHYIPDFRNFPAACKALKKLLKENKYDIFHSHLTSLSLFPLYLAERAGIEVRICHAHSGTDNKEATAVVKNILKRLSARNATRLFACSELSANWMYGKKDAFIMTNAVDRARFTFNPDIRNYLRAEYGIEGLCMGFAGRFEYQKNLQFFLKVAKAVQKRTDSTAVLVGDGSQKAQLKGMADENGLRVVFVEPTDKIEGWYSAFDCLVMTSNYEGLPLVGVEAQAAGLKCFFSDAVTKETDCGAATFLPANDPDIWADEILKTDLNTRMTSFDNEKFDLKSAAIRLQNEYLRLLKEIKKG